MMIPLPIRNSFCVTATFGQKGKYWATFHKGIDFVSTDRKVYSTVNGVVRYMAFDEKGWGYYVSIGDKKDNRHIFCHLKKGSIKVKKGDTVKVGEEIAEMGDTGNATGIHLHFQINNENKSPIDPKYFFSYNFTRGNYNTREFENMFTDEKDIPKYAKDSVNYLVKNKIIKGYDDGTLRPNEYINLSRLSVILYRIIKFIKG